MKKFECLIFCLLLVLISSCSNKSQKPIEIFHQNTVFNRDYALVKSYDGFNQHLQNQIAYNKQQEIERQIKINQQLELQKRKDQQQYSSLDPFYKNIQIIGNPSALDVLINKQNKLPESYIPNNLVLLDLPQLNSSKHYLVDVAYIALKGLINEAKINNHKLVIVSTYRSYQTQNRIYNNYVQRSGQKKADTYSARPGHSEHQSGLAVDISAKSLNGSLSQKFGATPEGTWLAQNAHRFGFILRYPENKSNITGYMYEPWHFRFVGFEIASAVYQCQCTYEEYIS